MVSRIDPNVPQIGSPIDQGEPLRENFRHARDEINMLTFGSGWWYSGSSLAIAHFGQTVPQIAPTSISPYRRVLRLHRAWTESGRDPLYVRFRIFHGGYQGEQTRIAQETIISEHNTGTGSGWSVVTTNTVGFNFVSDTTGDIFYVDIDAQGIDGARTRFQVVETNAMWALENQQAKNPDPESYLAYGESVVLRSPRRGDTWPQHNIHMGGSDGASAANPAGVPYATVDDIASILARLNAAGI